MLTRRLSSYCESLCIELGMTPIQTIDSLNLNECTKTVSITLDLVHIHDTSSIMPPDGLLRAHQVFWVRGVSLRV
jgi:hypothetical protein